MGLAMRRRIAIAAFVLVAMFPLTQRARARAGARTPCAGVARGVVVDTASRTLALCADGAADETFRVALGVGGLGKQRRGDNRTPLGDYALGAPRTSKWFGTFIPVGYPTAAQERAGFTGNAIGIHGPARGWAWAAAANTISDWTAGCIAVGSDAEIGRIAAWVKTRRSVGVHIE
jgi:hypothetical protein